VSQIVINVGTLSSLGKLYFDIAPSLNDIREAAKHREKPEVIWDFRFIEQKKMSMSALTAFLAIAKSISDYYKKPSPIILQWDPYTLHFLSDISFFKNSKELGILTWPDGMIGGFSEVNRLKTNTKIIYFDTIPNISYEKEKDINEWKEESRENFRNGFLVNFNDIFFDTIFREEWNDRLKYILSEIVSELTGNALLHGKETAFIGVQKSSRGITVCVCDGGIGFLESMKKTNKWILDLGINTNIEALFYASLMKEYDTGLKSVIEDVLESNGWVVMSSFDCEIRWEKYNWDNAKEEFDLKKYKTEKIDVRKILGQPLKGLASSLEHSKGHYKIYKNIIKGVRITFEIPF
jgi:hypothetical protein